MSDKGEPEVGPVFEELPGVLLVPEGLVRAGVEEAFQPGVQQPELGLLAQGRGELDEVLLDGGAGSLGNEEKKHVLSIKLSARALTKTLLEQ